MSTIWELKLLARDAKVPRFGNLRKKELCELLGVPNVPIYRPGTGVMVSYEDGTTETFVSLSTAGRALGKNSGSVSYCVSRGTKLRTKLRGVVTITRV